MSLLRPVVVVLLLLFAGGSVVHASPSYSRVVEETFELPCEPRCLLCHTSESGGFATANTKLGINLRKQYRAQCCDEDALESILLQLEAAALDSDGDGVPDAAELRAGTDPNDPSADTTLTCREKADSGCSIGIRGSATTWGLALLAIAYLTTNRIARRYSTRKTR